MSERTIIKLVVAGVVVLFLIIAVIVLFNLEEVKGNEIGVLETWSGGVDPNPRASKTYVLFPGFTQTMYKYPLSLYVFVMNDTPNSGMDHGRDYDSYKVQSAEGQDMKISLNVQWRIDPTKVIEIHKTVHPPMTETGEYVGEKLLRPVVMRVVKDQATRRTAVEAYSGSGLVKLQSDIYSDLTNPTCELRLRGIIVENFVIEGIALDPGYIGEITSRQIAMQKKLKEDELTKAADASALRAKAEAQADYNKRLVEAERDKQVGILEAERDRQVNILKAEAEQQKRVLEATGGRDASLLQAEGILAIGKAEAEAQRSKLSAYAADGSAMWVKVQIADALAKSMQNVKGYLPHDINVITLGTNFEDAVSKIVSGK